MSFPFFGNTINFLEHSSIFVREPGFFTAKPLLAHNLPLLPARRRGHMPMGLWMKELPPGGPDGSGEKSFLILFSVFGCPALPYDADLDLSGIFKLGLDALGDLPCDDNDIRIGYGIGADHDADLTSCLDGKALVDAFEGVGDLLQFFKAFDVVFKAFTPCAGTRCGYCVRRLNEYGLNGIGLDIVVMGEDTVDDLIVLAVLLGKIRADLSVSSLDLMVNGLTDIVEKTCALCELHVYAKLRSHESCKLRNFD